MKKKWLVFLIIPIVLVLSIYIIKNRKSYEVVRAKKGDITEAVYGLGTVKSRKIYEVKLGVMSSIKKMYFKEGDLVKKNDLLISFIDGPSFNAPFSGTLTTVNFHDGEIVPPQISILKIEDLDDTYIEVSLEQEGALRVSLGQQAKVLFESIKSNVINGNVGALFPRNGEFIAQIEVGKIDNKILPGMTADVTIEVGKIEDVVMIPLSSINNGMVILRRNGKKEKLKVNIGRTDNFWAEVIGNPINLDDEILIPIKAGK